jgi:NADP-dependent 3-hydroxy acid dehydrogenase YdfG
MIAQALEANGAIVYILGRRQEVLEKAANTAVSSTDFSYLLICHDTRRVMRIY